MKIILNLLILAACIGIFNLANSGRYFGAFFNKIFPCTQNVENSFPCYGWVDIVVMIFSVIVGLIAFGTLAFTLYKHIIVSPNS